jgi:chromosome segregation ATPase
MKFSIFLVCVVLCSCQLITGQKIDEQKKKDAEFESLINKVKATNEQSANVQKKASEKASSIVTNIVKKITDLKQEVSNLKNELNEVKAKLDVANTVDSGSKFELRPISNNKKDR